MKSFYLTITLCIFYTLLSATVPKGGILIIGYDGDTTYGSNESPDHLVMLVTVDIPAGEQIYFTDNEWDGSDWTTYSEGEVLWTTPAISAGQIITYIIESPYNHTIDVGGTLDLSGSGAGLFSLSGLGDDIYLFQGNGYMNPNNFITAFSSGPDANATLSGTGLTDGVNAIDDTNFSNNEVLLYHGSTNCNSFSTCATMICNPNNWSVEIGGDDESTNGIFPDIPADVPAAFGFPLPVELTAFSGRVSEEKQAILTWTTIAEAFNKGFEIQHANDHQDWTTIDFIEGQGNTFEETHYEFEHQQMGFGNNYYRLRQIDFDGHIDFSKTVVLENLTNETMKIFPNPTTSATVQLEITTEKTLDWQLVIFDVFGKMVHQESLFLEKGTQRIPLNLTQQIKGIYTVQLSDGDTFLQEKLVIGG